MRARQIERERYVEAFVLEFASHARDHVQRRDENRREADRCGIKSRLEPAAFGDRDLAHEKTRGEQDADNDGGEERQPCAHRFEHGVTGNGYDATFHGMLRAFLLRQYSESRNSIASTARIRPVMITKAPSAAERIALANPQWSLGLMLLALHLAIAWGIDDWWPRAFLLAHFGLFLLWQPVWRGEREVEPRQAFVVVGVGLLLVGWYNWWLMAVWLAVLFGLIGGMVPRIVDRRQRLISILAALYLLSMLLMWVVPQLFSGQVIEDRARAARALWSAVGAGRHICWCGSAHGRPHTPVAVDLFYSLILFLLVVALVLGSFVVREVSHGQYVIALAQTLFGIAVLLVALSWLWYPHSGFRRRRLHAVELSHESRASRSSAGCSGSPSSRRRKRSRSAFSRRRCSTCSTCRGCEAWSGRRPAGQGEFGTRTAYSTQVEFGDLKLVIHTRWEVSPAILLHLKLLARMVGHFYDAKRREQVQRQNAYTHAIYETGARLTHDVKNLLQSLKSLCAAAASSTPEQAVALTALMQRQLPQITQRLNTTLEKLRSPLQGEASEIEAADWWEKLVQRYSGRNIEFNLDGAMRPLKLPAELFDGVADNLIENAFQQVCRLRGAQGSSDIFVHGRRHAHGLRQWRPHLEEHGRPVVRSSRRVADRLRRRSLSVLEARRQVRLPPRACVAAATSSFR